MPYPSSCTAIAVTVLPYAESRWVLHIDLCSGIGPAERYTLRPQVGSAFAKGAHGSREAPYCHRVSACSFSANCSLRVPYMHNYTSASQ